MSWFDDLKTHISDWLNESGLTLPPFSPLFLMIVSVSVSSLSGIITRKLINLEELNKQNEQIQEHNKRKKKARETADKKMWQSVQKKEQTINDLQKSMMMKRMLPSLITFGPIIFIFGILRTTFQYEENILLNGFDNCTNSCGGVAVLPFNVPYNFPLIGKWFSPYAKNSILDIAGFGFFYFLTALTSSQLIQKIFGINLSGMQQNQGMGMR